MNVNATNVSRAPIIGDWACQRVTSHVASPVAESHDTTTSPQQCIDFSTADEVNNTNFAFESKITTDQSQVYAVLFAEMVIGVSAVLTNGFVLYAIATVPSLQTVTNYFVASLSAADLLVGLLGIPCVIIADNGLPSNFFGCLTVNMMIVILTEISIFSLLVIAVERFYAIRYPYQYCRVCTPRFAAIVIAITWVTSILLALVPTMVWNLYRLSTYNEVCAFVSVIDLSFLVYFNFFGCILIPLSIMTSIYMYIYTVVRKQLRMIAASQQVSFAASSSVNQVPRVTSRLNDVKARSRDEQMPSIQEEEPRHCWTISIIEKEERTPSQLPSMEELVFEEPIEGATFHSHASPIGGLSENRTFQNGNNIPASLPPSSSSPSAAAATTAKVSNASKKSNQWKNDIKAAKWFAIVLFVFAFCWIPLYILNCMTIFNGVTCMPCVTVTVLLSHANSAINPLLYAYGNSKIAGTFRRMIGCRSRTIED